MKVLRKLEKFLALILYTGILGTYHSGCAANNNGSFTVVSKKDNWTIQYNFKYPDKIDELESYFYANYTEGIFLLDRVFTLTYLEKEVLKKYEKFVEEYEKDLVKKYGFSKEKLKTRMKNFLNEQNLEPL